MACDLDPLIDSIYDAALRPENWGQIIAQVGARIGATSGTSLWFGKSGMEIVRAEVWNIDPEALSSYQKHYLAFCPRYRASRTLEVGALYDDHALRRSSEGAVRDYYAFMDRYDLGLARIALAEKRPDLTIGMNFYNRERDGLSAEGAAILGFLAPHFRRACNMTQALADVTDRAALGDAWFHSRTASLTLDASGTVVRVNAAAEAVLASGDGLVLANGRLTAQSHHDRSKLEAEIARMVSTLSAKSGQENHFVLVTRPSGLPPLAVSVVPLHRPTSREVAILTIAATVPEISPQSLRHAFGLTQSEARIAASLCTGSAPEQIAEARGVSLHTVRSQIKAIYVKLDVGSQTELVSRVTASVLGVRM